MKYIINKNQLKVTTAEVNTPIELAYWIERLWSSSYEDIEYWEKVDMTKELCSALAQNIYTDAF